MTMLGSQLTAMPDPYPPSERSAGRTAARLPWARRVANGFPPCQTVRTPGDDFRPPVPVPVSGANRLEVTLVVPSHGIPRRLQTGCTAVQCEQHQQRRPSTGVYPSQHPCPRLATPVPMIAMGAVHSWMVSHPSQARRFFGTWANPPTERFAMDPLSPIRSLSLLPKFSYHPGHECHASQRRSRPGPRR